MGAEFSIPSVFSGSNQRIKQEKTVATESRNDGLEML